MQLHARGVVEGQCEGMAVTASAVVVSCGLVGRVVRRVVAARVVVVGASCSCSSSVVASSSSSARVVPAVVVVVTGELVGSNRESSKQRHSWQPERGSMIVTLRDPGRQLHGRNVVEVQWSGTLYDAVVESAVVVAAVVVVVIGRVVVGRVVVGRVVVGRVVASVVEEGCWRVVKGPVGGTKSRGTQRHWMIQLVRGLRS